MISTFPCSSEQSFLGRLPVRAESEAFEQGKVENNKIIPPAGLKKQLVLKEDGVIA